MTRPRTPRPTSRPPAPERERPRGSVFRDFVRTLERLENERSARAAREEER
jgi:hypothetical protein